MLQSDENDPEHPSDSDGSTKGEPQVNINSPTMHLPILSSVFEGLWGFSSVQLLLSPCIVKEQFDFPSCLAWQTIYWHYCVSADPYSLSNFLELSQQHSFSYRRKSIHSQLTVTYYRNSRLAIPSCRNSHLQR